jgi:hypothetical protein
MEELAWSDEKCCCAAKVLDTIDVPGSLVTCNASSATNANTSPLPIHRIAVRHGLHQDTHQFDMQSIGTCAGEAGNKHVSAHL